MSLFDVDEIGSEIMTAEMPEKPRHSKPYAVAKAGSKKLLRKEAAAEIVKSIGGWPAQGKSIDLITNGQSNAGGFYELIRDEWQTIQSMCIATWIINEHYIDMLSKDVETGKIKELVFIISNRMSQLGKGHTPAFNRLKTKFSQLPNIRFRVANSHAKTYTMTNGVDYITVDGSGNWSENPRIENYTLTNEKEKFDFRKRWMSELCDAE